MNLNLTYAPEVDVNDKDTVMVQVMVINGKKVARAWIQEFVAQPKPPKEKKAVRFRNLIQHPEPDKLIKRLHALIDGRMGADVGCVLLRCMQENWLIRNPTQAEFCEEFELVGKWNAIHNYMDENNMKALSRANKVVIF